MLLKMSQEIIDARALGRIHRQKAILQVSHQQPLTFKHTPDPRADPANQLLKGLHRRRRYPAKAQPLTARHLHTVEE